MPKNEKRVTVALPEEIHSRMTGIAKLLGLDVREATAEAVQQWSDRNAQRAQRKAQELLKPAAAA